MSPGLAHDAHQRLELDGVVTEVLPHARLGVELENGHRLIAYVAGRMRQDHIRIKGGDRVKVELTPYDLSKGRVTFRYP